MPECIPFNVANKDLSKSQSETGVVANILILKVEARVVLTKNLNVKEC